MKLFWRITVLLLTPKIQYLNEWELQILGRDGWKGKAKTEKNCRFFR